METEFIDFRVGALVKYVDIEGKQEGYHKARGLGIITGWSSNLGRWKVRWPNAIAGDWNTFEWTTHLRTIA